MELEVKEPQKFRYARASLEPTRMSFRLLLSSLFADQCRELDVFVPATLDERIRSPGIE